MPARRVCDHDAVLADVLAGGMTYHEIASRYGVGDETVGRIARAAGIRRQLPGKKSWTEKPGRHDPYWPVWFGNEWNYWRRVVLKYGKSRQAQAGEKRQGAAAHR